MRIEDNEYVGRTMGGRYARVHVPELSLTERLFLALWVGCAVIASIVAGQKMTPYQFKVMAFCMWIMVGVLTYWMRHYPAYVLQLLLWPFTRQMFNWPRVLLWPVRIFGCFGFFMTMVGCPAVFLPDIWTRSARCQDFLVVNAVIISCIALWKRKPREA